MHSHYIKNVADKTLSSTLHQKPLLLARSEGKSQQRASDQGFQQWQRLIP